MRLTINEINANADVGLGVSIVTSVEGDVRLDTRHGSGADPLVSIIVPVYNVAPYVAACLESIRSNAAALSLELIIIDDGSTDDSHKVIETALADGDWPEVLWMRWENRGVSAARNLGVRLARGCFLGFLDSDDLMEPGALSMLLSYAVEHGCDLVLGRARVFDSQSCIETPFYDHQIWDALLSGQSSRILAVSDAPVVLSLEPNPNYRLIRRAVLIEHDVIFPEGLLFEDAPVHFQTLLHAGRIGLLDMPYYRYRVNRPGKITESTGRRRFDVLEVAKRALDDLRSFDVSPEQGGAALRVLLRLMWGCGTMTLPRQRLAFFTAACRLLSAEVPRAWLAGYLAQHQGDPRHIVLAVLMTSDAGGRLADLSLGRHNVPSMARFLYRHGYAGVVAKSAWMWWWQKR